MMTDLPTHSHHRAPLVHFLSAGLPSTIAAKILHTTPSYVRQCKRKLVDASDLLTEKYSHDVRRQKLHPAVLTEVIEYLRAACPTKSGSKQPTFRQYIADAALYDSYRTGVTQPVSFNTFLAIKKWLRARRVGQYFVDEAAALIQAN